MKGIAGKLVLVMGSINYVKNDSKNSEQNYRYASDEAVLQEVKKAMVAHNVCSFPTFKILSNAEGTSNSGKKYNKIEMECEITLIDADTAETITSNGFGCGIDYGGDKALMKAQTVSHKYSLLKLFNIPTGDNPESDETVDREAKKPPVSTFTPPTQQTPAPANPPQKIEPKSTALLFKKNCGGGKFAMVEIKELTPKQVEWYANVSKEERLAAAANDYILNNPELFVKDEA